MNIEARPILLLFATAIALAVVATGCSSNSRSSAGPDTSIPAIARFAGVAVGHSTQEDLARHWGEGEVITGGHPNSGRVWRIKGSDWVLNTDGFDYSDRGLVVDDLKLETASGQAANTPEARVPQGDFTWLGGIRLGMSRSDVEKFLKSKSLVATEANQELTVKADGHYTLVNGTLGIWMVKLNFQTNILSKLCITAGERTTQ